jgi:murein DD-endopeptidase MepM/ murein hydrolase activator NlpD
MLLEHVRRPRGAGVVAGSAAAVLAVGVLVALPDQTPSAEATTLSVDASVARSSSALSRSLAAQTRLLAASAAPTSAVTAAAPAAKVAPASVGPVVWKGLPVLEPGARGAAVKTLQKKLGVKPTGWYGPMTLAAVVAFQKSRGLPAKGYVGLRTWQALYTPKATPAKKRSSATSRSTVRAEVTNGRVCPAPGSKFGSGWGAPRGSRSHKGVDLMARRGTPILAVEAGYILRAGYQNNGAIRIVQQGRSGSKFYYGHMDSITVRAGSRVARGQVIGYMGDTGSPGQVHLHFEYWRSGGESAAVDPYPLLKQLCWS